MQLFRRCLIGVALIVLAPGASAPAEAPPFDDLRWLNAASDRVAALTRARPEPLKLKGLSQDQRFLVEIGRIAFRAPDTLGGLAARFGMSCQTCHTHGGRNESFFLDGLSATPGTFDVTNSVFGTKTQDHIHNPLPIPTLYHVARTAPYAHDGRFATLEAMVRHVIEDEFDGAKPEPIVFSGLIAYLSALGEPAAGEMVALDFNNAYGDIVRGTETLKTALTLKNARLVAFIVQALRRELGRIAQRFPGEPEAQTLLVNLSLGLREIARDAESGDYRLARVSLASFERALKRAGRDLARRAPSSLYDPKILRQALEAAQ